MTWVRGMMWNAFSNVVTNAVTFSDSLQFVLKENPLVSELSLLFIAFHYFHLANGIDKNLCSTVVLGGDEFSHSLTCDGGFAHL